MDSSKNRRAFLIPGDAVYCAPELGDLDPRTQQRYENAKAENVIESLSPHDHSQELEQNLGHEDEGLKSSAGS